MRPSDVPKATHQPRVCVWGQRSLLAPLGTLLLRLMYAGGSAGCPLLCGEPLPGRVCVQAEGGRRGKPQDKVREQGWAWIQASSHHLQPEACRVLFSGPEHTLPWKLTIK